MSLNAKRFLRALFDAAVLAAQPARCLPGRLPEPLAAGRITVIACGTAAAGMAQAAELHYESLDALHLVAGLAIVPHGSDAEFLKIKPIEAGYPTPDESSVYAAGEAIAMARSGLPGDLILFLISGGASALCAAPSAGIDLAAKQALAEALLKAGAHVREADCVRKHLSRFKGGRFAAYATASTLVTLAISDSPGDEPEIIGSGPSCPDTTTLAEARAIAAKYAIKLAPQIHAALNNPANETPKPGNPIFANTRYELVATGRDSLEAAGEIARGLGYDVIVLGDRLEGEAREVAQSHAQLARRCRDEGRRAVILSGGKLTRTAAGDGKGGPNQDYALSLAIALGGEEGIAALAGSTSGIDGDEGSNGGPAGAMAGAGTIRRAAALNLVPATFFDNNGSAGLFRLTDDLLVCSPTGTSVGDFRAIVVDSSIRD